VIDRGGDLCLGRGVCSRLSSEDVLMAGECGPLDSGVLGFCLWACLCARGDGGEYGRAGEGNGGSVVELCCCKLDDLDVALTSRHQSGQKSNNSFYASSYTATLARIIFEAISFICFFFVVLSLWSENARILYKLSHEAM
jgi:hypothetical protein